MTWRPLRLNEPAPARVKHGPGGWPVRWGTTGEQGDLMADMLVRFLEHLVAVYNPTTPSGHPETPVKERCRRCGVDVCPDRQCPVCLVASGKTRAVAQICIGQPRRVWSVRLREVA